jgi:hypothetical protein
MSWGGGFLQRWADANRPAWNNDRRRHNRNNRRFNPRVDSFRPQGGAAWKPTPGSSFSYQGGPRPAGQPTPPAANGTGGQTQSKNPFQVGYNSNLENNLPLPQGSQRPFAMPTSISSLITNLLYQSRQNPNDVWGSAFGIGRSTNQSGYSGGTAMGNYAGTSGSDSRGTGGMGQSSGSSSSSGGSWGAFNNMADASTYALQLADAYFAPKQLDLAYQLGDMETDMQRLAVNLGRQIDDPVLQAKLYKEAMKQVRTLDSDENSFALQMLEQTRKESVQNQQFYDNLALEQDKMQQQDDQFYAQLQLQKKQLQLSASQQQTASGG